MDTELSASSAVNVDWILRELGAAMDRLPEQAIGEARRCRELVVPRLIEVLQQATAKARGGIPPEGNAAFFALFLLTEFKAREAWPAVLEAMSLRGDGPFDLFSDAVTSVWSRVIVTLAPEPLEAIDSLIVNRQLNEYVRWGAANCYPYLVRDGRLTRVQVVERLKSHLRRAVAANDDAIVGGLVVALSFLWPMEARTEIDEAFARGLVEPFMIDRRDIEDSIARGEAAMRRYLDGLAPSTIVDTIEELRGWASFRDDNEAEMVGLRNGDESLDLGDFEECAPELPVQQPIHSAPKIGRNDPCPCGSGKKFKTCCGSRTSGPDAKPLPR